jgi:hypothetical protein
VSDPAGSTPGGAVLLIFLDGVGLAPTGRDNPLSQVPMPCLGEVLGRPLVRDGAGGYLAPWRGRRVLLRALDACLGVPGLPQSATGQTALFTGVNAPALIGDHVTAQPTARLRAVIEEESVLKRAAEAGARVLFANAHSDLFWERVRHGKQRLGASTLTALAAGAPIATMADLDAGRAVYWDMTHEVAREHLGIDLPLVAAREAGARLARLAAAHDLVLYETFLPDLAGHQRIDPAWVLSRLDDLLGGVFDHLPAGITLVLTSDHGNVEDTTTKAHTANPVPLLVVGPGADHFEAAAALTDVAPGILAVLGAEVGG